MTHADTQHKRGEPSHTLRGSNGKIPQVVWAAVQDQRKAHRWSKGFHFLIFIYKFVFEKVVFHVFKGNISMVLDGEDAKIKKTSPAIPCV